MNFGEKTSEKLRNGNYGPVIKTPKYEESKKKAEDLISSGKYGLSEADFWILKHETKTEKVTYDGLIISHNGVLKINDSLDKELKFRPECASSPMEAFYTGGMVQLYSCPEQGIYEVGEVTASNCKNDYPYAMVIKRLFDRVVLKTSKVAFYGIYSEAEADEFKPDEDVIPTDGLKKAEDAERRKEASKKVDQVKVDALMVLAHEVGSEIANILKAYGLTTLKDMNCGQWKDCMEKLTWKKENGKGHTEESKG